MATGNPIATLRRLARRRSPNSATEVCDFCSLELAPRHRHLLEMTERKIVCVCDACALRFENAVGGRFKLVPRDVRALPNFKMSDEQWENLALPIGLVFIFQNSATGRPAAFYPGPAGATESLLTFSHWAEAAADNPELQAMMPDVEALLINRIGSPRHSFIVPVDLCFELTGVIRKHWRGLSGGEAVWQEIESFFGRLREEARAVRANEPAKEAEALYA